MTIDWLCELERNIEYGKEVYACAGMGHNDWVIGKTMDELRKLGQRAADHKKLPINIVKLVLKTDALAGDNFLVPTSIDNPGTRGEPMIKWKVVETKEAADMMRDVRHGPSPVFAMQVQETLNPKG